MTRSRPLIKVLVALGVLTVLGFLFVRTIRETRAEPYIAKLDHLRKWSLSLESVSDPGEPMLTLRPPQVLVMDLFRQVFMRAMESLKAQATPAMPLLLRGEFDRAFAGHVTPEALLGAARNAGLESAVFKPRCLAHRRVAAPGPTQQLYVALFDTPAEFRLFREKIGSMMDSQAAGGASFDPAALQPLLFIAASDPTFSQWTPLTFDPETDCVAPIVTE